MLDATLQQYEPLHSSVSSILDSTLASLSVVPAVHPLAEDASPAVIEPKRKRQRREAPKGATAEEIRLVRINALPIDILWLESDTDIIGMPFSGDRTANLTTLLSSGFPHELAIGRVLALHCICQTDRRRRPKVNLACLYL
jgi:hypothetical protein